MTDLIRSRYELRDLIASGGMGSVFRGWDVQAQEAVAIKVLKTNIQNADASGIERFLREGMVLRQLNHPNIVKVLATTEQDGQFYLVMELLEGGTLGDYLQANAPLNIDQMLEIALEITDALTRAHHIKIIHRDLKPANILMDENGSPRVTDFGLAFSDDLETLTASQVVMGTVPYMSPEALQGNDHDFRTDIWSLGVMFYEMLTGQRPFRGETTGELITKIITAPPTPDLAILRPDCPELLVDLVASMLTKDPLRRISSMRQVATTLESQLFGHDQSLVISQPAVELRPAIEKLLIIVMYTDIEKSTQKWEQYGDAMDWAIAQHDRLTQETVERFDGKILRHRGDGMSAVFETGDPLSCAIALQQAFAEHDWRDIGEFRIRVGLDAGQVSRHTYESGVVGQKEEYFGRPMNRAARVLDTGSGDQILLTAGVMEILDLPDGATTQDLGEHSLKDLPEPIKIYGLIHPDLPQTDFPPLKSLSSIPNNLPISSTSFIGREREIEEVLDQFTQEASRLVTILGAGGMGKTRLALEVGQRLMPHSKDGVFWVDLAPLDSPSNIPQLIADAFNMSTEGDVVEQLITVLKHKNVILLIDNFEHVLAGTDLIDRILFETPQAKILATSRTALNLDWEWRYELSGLEVDEAGIRLFEERAQQVRRDFDLNRELDDVIQICQLVEGMPLGIELAATWMRMLTAEELLEELGESLDILTSQQRTTTDRHRSLQAVFDYSWNLLTPREQSSLVRLSIFRESFDRAAAKAIAEASLFTLSSLVDKSLLKVDEDGRYFFHELLRQFSYKRLSEAGLVTATEDKYIAYYVDLAVTMADRIMEGGLENQRSALKILVDETATVDQALLLAADRGDLQTIEKTYVPLQFRWVKTGTSTHYIQLHQEIYDRLPVDTHQLTSPENARAYVVLLVACAGTGSSERSTPEQHQQILDIVEEYKLWANPHWFVFYYVATYAYDDEKIISAEQFNEYCQSLVKNRRLTGKPYEIAHALYHYQGSCLSDEERLTTIAEALALLESINDHWLIGFLYVSLAGYYLVGKNDLDLALPYARKIENFAKALDIGSLQSSALWLSLTIASDLGLYEEYIDLADKTIEFHQARGNISALHNIWHDSAWHLMIRLGNYSRASQYLDEAAKYTTTPVTQIQMLLSRSRLACYQNELALASDYVKQARQKFSQSTLSENHWIAIRIIQHNAYLDFIEGRFIDAQAKYEQVLSIQQKDNGDNKGSIAYFRLELAETQLYGNDWKTSEALVNLILALEELKNRSDLSYLCQGIYVVGLYLYRMNVDNSQTATYLGLAQHHRATLIDHKERAQNLLAELESVMPANEFTATVQRGKELDPREAVQQFLDEYGSED